MQKRLSFKCLGKRNCYSQKDVGSGDIWSVRPEEDKIEEYNPRNMSSSSLYKESLFRTLGFENGNLIAQLYTWVSSSSKTLYVLAHLDSFGRVVKYGSYVGEISSGAVFAFEDGTQLNFGADDVVPGSNGGWALSITLRMQPPFKDYLRGLRYRPVRHSYWRNDLSARRVIEWPEKIENMNFNFKYQVYKNSNEGWYQVSNKVKIVPVKSDGYTKISK